jgi:hypothetical protein
MLQQLGMYFWFEFFTFVVQMTIGLKDCNAESNLGIDSAIS